MISPWYEKALNKTAYSMLTAKKYYPRDYKNVTDTLEEFLCVDLETYLTPRTCQHKTVAPSETMIDTLSDNKFTI